MRFSETMSIEAELDIVTVVPTMEVIHAMRDALYAAELENLQPDMFLLGPEASLHFEALCNQPAEARRRNSVGDPSRREFLGRFVVCDPASPPMSVRVGFQRLTMALGDKVKQLPVVDLVKQAGYLDRRISELQDMRVALDAEMEAS